MAETIATVDQPYLALECGLGEGPYYEEGTGELRFVDIMKKRIHTIDLKEGPSSHKVVQVPDSVGITADIDGRDGEYIVAAKRGFAIFNKATGGLRYIKKAYEDNAAMADRMRFNDGAVDTKGRFWAGTMYDFHAGEPQPEGSVFRLDPDGSLHEMIKGVTIPNGMGWSLDDKTMYVTDSPTKCIFAYDYDSEAGSISNKRVFFKVDTDDEQVPDGCSIDSEGHLWVCIHGGGKVIRISPEGKPVAQISLPNTMPTCPCFAGPHLKELFVTSAGFGEDEERPAGSKGDGSLFRVPMPVSGSRSNKFILSF